MASNDKAGVAFAQPKTKDVRAAIAEKCCAALKMSIPLLVDEIDDRVGHAYSGMPDRLYLIDRSGRVAYKGGRGPFGFKPLELEQAMAMLLLDESSKDPAGGARVPLLSDREAWTRLPKPIEGEPASLPAWARALVESMPRTTAAMLELDFIQRRRSPLPPTLRAALRYVAARENRSPYGQAYALADFKQAGATAVEVEALVANPIESLADHRQALHFAQQLTKEAYKVSDTTVTSLRKRYGDAGVVAMVQCLAYANFQDRLLLALGITVEEGGPLPPIAVRFAKPLAGGAVPAERRMPEGADQTPAGTGKVTDREWTKLDYEHLQRLMETQRSREPRIPVPSFESVRKHLPPAFPKGQQLRIRWSLVCLGYQPELASAWTLCTRTFGEESKQDRVFEESLFWVVTRSLQCFY